MTLPEIARQAAEEAYQDWLKQGPMVGILPELFAEAVAVAVLQEARKEFNGALPYDATVRSVIDDLIAKFSPSTPESQK